MHLGGGSTSAAATNLAHRRVQWFANTFKGWANSGGNGAAMRIQPHVWAARDPGDPTTFLPDVIRNSICTHSHPRGLLGANLHALVLAHTMVNGHYPSPDEVMATTNVVAGLPDIIRSDIEVWHYWRSTFERESGAFEKAWAQTVEECRQAIQIAADTKGDNGADRYMAIVDRLGLRDQARRGDGTLTAVAAMGLIWCEGQPEQALSIAANVVGTDTDTIATMAGAILGAVAEEEPPVEVLDADLFRSEASRLAEIACGGTPQNHRYPDLLHWSAPKGRADALVELDDRSLYVRGFGRAEAQSEPIPASQSKFSWQWVRLEAGQTLLVKRRSELARSVEDRGLSSVRPSEQAPSIGVYPEGIADAPTAEDVGQPDGMPSETPLKSQSRQSKTTVDIETMLDYLDRHNYDDLLVGQALRRVVGKCTPSQVAAFSAVLFDRLRELPSQPERPQR